MTAKYRGPQSIRAESAEAALTVTQTGTGNSLVVEDSANPDSTPFVVDADGRVVSGHTASVSGDRAQVIGGSIGVLTFTNNNADFTVKLHKSRSVDPATKAIVQSGDGLGGVRFLGDDGTAFIEAASIRAAVDGTPGTNDMPGRLVFSTTADGASTPTERLRITSAGNVGIGTTSPATFIHVAGQAAGAAGIYVDQYSTDATGPGVLTRKARGTSASPSAVQSGDYITALLGRGYGATAFGTSNVGLAGFVAAENFTDSAQGTNFVVGTTPTGSTTRTERMRIDNAGQVTVGLGSAAAPVLSFSGDTNTGVFSPGADAVSLATGGVERFRINSAGTAMIGDTSRNTVYVTSEFTPGFQSAVGSGTGGFYRYTADADGPALVFSKSRNATAGSHTVVNSGDTVGYIGFAGSDGTAFRTAATIFAQVDGTPGASDMPGRLIFTTTADGSATPTERMRIDNAGNVGIGTTSPVSILDVSGGSIMHQRLAATTTYNMRRANASTTIVADGDNIADIVAFGYDGSQYVAAGRIRVAVDGTPGASDMPGRLMFYTTADGGTTENERMRINNAGLITGTGTSLGAWTAYTPTLSGTGWAIGNGTIGAVYCQIGKTVHFTSYVTFGSTSTYGTGSVKLTFPVTASSAARFNIFSVATDVSASSLYTLAAGPSSTTEFFLRALGTGGLNGVSNSTTPFTWASGDVIQVSGTYEAA